MRIELFRKVRWAGLGICLLYIMGCRWVPSWGEGYARSVYPFVSSALSAAVSWIPFSLEEMVVVGVAGWLIGYPVYARRWKQAKGWVIVRRELEVVLALYCWFYMGWGNNYYRYDFFQRSATERKEYQEENFRRFLEGYTAKLNAAYVPAYSIDFAKVEEEVKQMYAELPDRFGLSEPRAWQHPKKVLFNGLYSAVGVLGYMGPFFAESQLNTDLLPVQYPFTYAHEYAHLMGISSEAEANFWAYQICIRSSDAGVRYAGYVGILGYVIRNARSVLDEDAYRQWADAVRQEVWEERKAQQQYWFEKYSPLVGRVQDQVYDWFLRGNNIPSGKKNYAQVVGMIMAMPDEWWY